MIMTRAPWVFCLLLFSGLGPMQASAAQNETVVCSLGAITREHELYTALGGIAVQAIELASRPGSAVDPDLKRLVSDDAVFELGAGDMSGWRRGVGISGARAVAQAFHADGFRFLYPSGIPRPVDPCGDNEIDVDFTDSRTNQIVKLSFKVSAGRIVSTTGWVSYFAAGPVLLQPEP